MYNKAVDRSLNMVIEYSKGKLTILSSSGCQWNDVQVKVMEHNRDAFFLLEAQPGKKESFIQHLKESLKACKPADDCLNGIWTTQEIADECIVGKTSTMPKNPQILTLVMKKNHFIPFYGVENQQ